MWEAADWYSHRKTNFQNLLFCEKEKRTIMMILYKIKSIFRHTELRILEYKVNSLLLFVLCFYANKDMLECENVIIMSFLFALWVISNKIDLIPTSKNTLKKIRKNNNKKTH